MGDWDLRIPTTIYKIGTNENPLCSTGSSTQGSAVTEMGRKLKKKKSIYVFVWASLKAQLEKNLPAVQETRLDSWGGKICWRRDRLPIPVFLGFPGVSLVKNPPAMQEIWVVSLGWEDPLEKGKATHSSILSWRIPWTM